MDTQPHFDRPGLWRLGAAARFAGLTPELFEAAAARGDIPVTVEKIGPKETRYVRVAELEAWLGTKHIDLF